MFWRGGEEVMAGVGVRDLRFRKADLGSDPGESPRARWSLLDEARRRQMGHDESHRSQTDIDERSGMGGVELGAFQLGDGGWRVAALTSVGPDETESGSAGTQERQGIIRPKAGR